MWEWLNCVKPADVNTRYAFLQDYSGFTRFLQGSSQESEMLQMQAATDGWNINYIIQCN